MSPSTSSQWIEWLAISIAESSAGPFGDKAGIYQIRADESGGANPIPIPRLGSVDVDRLLYIGYSEASIATRVKIFRTIHPPYLLTRKKLPKHELQVRAKLLPTSEGYAAEQAGIVTYGNGFGESPPCNRNAAKKTAISIWDTRTGESNDESAIS
jgi:hypothetical protein